ncbi:hypothetical protein [Achromobacter insolitus]|uniref:hypothetical protein n=1 Tax=Achromobacter insolitus TaxID=217204 RepID=UPI0020A39E2E|nr:hypothetical protein [Achromobacter insolitus]MCP1402271.1 hypothetical protein [Achromobacter insolitus]
MEIRRAKFWVGRACQRQWPLFRDPAEQWYRGNNVEIGVREFPPQDPDGYLLRFSARIGERRHGT